MRCALDQIARMIEPMLDAHTFPWAAIGRRELAALKTRLMSRYGPRSVNRCLSAVRGVMRELWRDKRISAETYAEVKDVKALPRSSFPQAGRALEEEEIITLLEACIGPTGKRDRAMLVLMYAGGLRRAEIPPLTADAYDFETGALRVIGKGSKERIVYIPADWRSYIEELIYERLGAGILFARNSAAKTPRRLGVVGINHILEEIRKRTGVIHVTPHDLRRSFATHLIDKGADLSVVADLMGHASIETTRIYDRRGEAAKKKAVELLNKKKK